VRPIPTRTLPQCFHPGQWRQPPPKNPPDPTPSEKPSPAHTGGASDAPIIEGEGAGGLTGRVQTINSHLWLPFRPNLHLSESPGGPFLNPMPGWRVLVMYAVGREPSLKGYTHGAENSEDLQAVQPPDGDGDKHGSEWEQSGSRYLVLRLLRCGGQRPDLFKIVRAARITDATPCGYSLKNGTFLCRLVRGDRSSCLCRRHLSKFGMLGVKRRAR
jgi:hypothetical protein